MGAQESMGSVGRAPVDVDGRRNPRFERNADRGAVRHGAFPVLGECSRDLLMEGRRPTSDGLRTSWVAGSDAERRVLTVGSRGACGTWPGSAGECTAGDPHLGSVGTGRVPRRPPPPGGLAGGDIAAGGSVAESWTRGWNTLGNRPRG